MNQTIQSIKKYQSDTTINLAYFEKLFKLINSNKPTSPSEIKSLILIINSLLLNSFNSSNAFEGEFNIIVDDKEESINISSNHSDYDDLINILNNYNSINLSLIKNKLNSNLSIPLDTQSILNNQKNNTLPTTQPLEVINKAPPLPTKDNLSSQPLQTPIALNQNPPTPTISNLEDTQSHITLNQTKTLTNKKRDAIKSLTKPNKKSKDNNSKSNPKLSEQEHNLEIRSNSESDCEDNLILSETNSSDNESVVWELICSTDDYIPNNSTRLTTSNSVSTSTPTSSSIITIPPALATTSASNSNPLIEAYPINSLSNFKLMQPNITSHYILCDQDFYKNFYQIEWCKQLIVIQKSNKQTNGSIVKYHPTQSFININSPPKSINLMLLNQDNYTVSLPNNKLIADIKERLNIYYYKYLYFIRSPNDAQTNSKPKPIYFNTMDSNENLTNLNEFINKNIMNLFKNVTYIPILPEFILWSKYIALKSAKTHFKETVEFLYSIITNLNYKLDDSIINSLNTIKSLKGLPLLSNQNLFSDNIYKFYNTMLSKIEKFKSFNNTSSFINTITNNNPDSITQETNQELIQDKFYIIIQIIGTIKMKKISDSILINISKLILGSILNENDLYFKSNSKEVKTHRQAILKTNNKIIEWVANTNTSNISFANILKEINLSSKKEFNIEDSYFLNQCRRIYLLYTLGFKDTIFLPHFKLKLLERMSREQYLNVYNFLKHKVLTLPNLVLLNVNQDTNSGITEIFNKYIFPNTSNINYNDSNNFTKSITKNL
ncbi:hypothetical protein CONCODRAFT_13523 [Conidiobolus coronatus NRRL 28638]|uniref:Uncharacterized protein n=1 Tax=Conidiobolus coronatus (strain ATCC 28846 / CBS 209.66 / NRRL 28638) TaxID=796925 RepID=A0A137NQK4_CONC2|nr:hypothetical protein CONCODRAFT_13523 [Conidiobolus coronatus NRRL 28638]|eukprot:KXN65037.1 hypothetical protein CONCODRAFT_13523 [Conidiobolus coronatus NRRL 28638]